MARECPKCSRSFENDLALCPFCIVGLRPAGASPRPGAVPHPPGSRTVAPTTAGVGSAQEDPGAALAGESADASADPASSPTVHSSPLISGMEPEEPKIALRPAPPYPEEESPGAALSPPASPEPSPGVNIHNLMGPNVGTVLKDRYRLEKLLGRGGFGRVYLAFDQKLQFKVAIKLIPSEWCGQPEILEALEREARLAIRLAHPNIVRVFNLETAGGDNFIVMEYVPGENLSQYYKRKGKLPEYEVLDIAIQASEALAYAHGERVVHRDIKPSNIILAPRGDGTNLVKMVDFGIAREVKDSISRVTRQTSSGTPIYMSPEQLRGNYDHRTDIYSLGVTLYELLYGQPPFHKGGLESLMWQIMNEAPQPIPGVSDWFNSALLKCLEKKKERRWATAADMREGLVKREVPQEPRRVGPARAAGAGASVPKAQTKRVVASKEQQSTPKEKKSAGRSIATAAFVGVVAAGVVLGLAYAGILYGPDAWKVVKDRIAQARLEQAPVQTPRPEATLTVPLAAAPTAQPPGTVTGVPLASPSPLPRPTARPTPPFAAPTPIAIVSPPPAVQAAGTAAPTPGEQAAPTRPPEDIAQSLVEAEKLGQGERLNMADARKATDLYDRVLRTEPDNQRAVTGKKYVTARRRALAARQEGRWPEARGSCEEALKARPGDRAVTALLASIQREEGSGGAPPAAAEDPAERSAYLDLLSRERQGGNRQMLLKSWELFHENYSNGPYAEAAKAKIQGLKDEMLGQPEKHVAPTPPPGPLSGIASDAKTDFEAIEQREALPADEEIALLQAYLSHYRGEVMPEKYWVDQAKSRLRLLLAPKQGSHASIPEPMPPEPPRTEPSMTPAAAPAEPLIQIREPMKQIIERMTPAPGEGGASATPVAP